MKWNESTSTVSLIIKQATKTREKKPKIKLINRNQQLATINIVILDFWHCYLIVIFSPIHMSRQRGLFSFLVCLNHDDALLNIKIIYLYFIPSLLLYSLNSTHKINLHTISYRHGKSHLPWDGRSTFFHKFE